MMKLLILIAIVAIQLSETAPQFGNPYYGGGFGYGYNPYGNPYYGGAANAFYRANAARRIVGGALYGVSQGLLWG